MCIDCEGTQFNLNGVAPTTSMLAGRANQFGVTLPPAVGNGGPREFNRPISAENKWALLFRLRWDARLGTIKAVEPLTPAEMIAKVWNSKCSQCPERWFAVLRKFGLA